MPKSSQEGATPTGAENLGAEQARRWRCQCLRAAASGDDSDAPLGPGPRNVLAPGPAGAGGGSLGTPMSGASMRRGPCAGGPGETQFLPSAGNLPVSPESSPAG